MLFANLKYYKVAIKIIPQVKEPHCLRFTLDQRPFELSAATNRLASTMFPAPNVNSDVTSSKQGSKVLQQVKEGDSNPQLRELIKVSATQ